MSGNRRSDAVSHGLLPDCMMPDGAEPCAAYQNLERELRAAQAPGVTARSENRTQIPAGFKLVPDQPVMWRREWDGDVSDEGQWVYAATREELDEYGPWEPLYSEQGPL